MATSPWASKESSINTNSDDQLTSNKLLKSQVFDFENYSLKGTEYQRFALSLGLNLLSAYTYNKSSTDITKSPIFEKVVTSSLLLKTAEIEIRNYESLKNIKNVKADDLNIAKARSRRSLELAIAYVINSFRNNPIPAYNLNFAFQFEMDANNQEFLFELFPTANASNTGMATDFILNTEPKTILLAGFSSIKQASQNYSTLLAQGQPLEISVFEVVNLDKETILKLTIDTIQKTKLK
jgi:hypothetical protein